MLSAVCLRVSSYSGDTFSWINCFFVVRCITWWLMLFPVPLSQSLFCTVSYCTEHHSSAARLDFVSSVNWNCWRVQPSAMWRSVVGRVVGSITKHRNAFMFSVEQTMKSWLLGRSLSGNSHIRFRCRLNLSNCFLPRFICLRYAAGLSRVFRCRFLAIGRHVHSLRKQASPIPWCLSA